MLGLYHLKDQAEIAWSTSFYAYLYSQLDHAGTVIDSSMTPQDEAAEEKLEEDFDALLKDDE